MIRIGFPGANFIGLILRQIARPLSKSIVKRVKKRPLLRKYYMIKWEIQVTIKQKPIHDNHSTELGTNLFREITIKDRLTRRVEDQVISTKLLRDITVEYSREVGRALADDPEK
ncbi:hypothetical protein PUN28_005567 [Cardiocondyla obscurior]|uniref:Ribosomal protein S17 n=1 Tax=Cardiocondyla obscurior TaxID=286306 RepID=A0AAW2GL49_9HYME